MILRKGGWGGQSDAFAGDFEVIDEDIEEVIGSLDAVLNPKARNPIDVFFAVQKFLNLAEVIEDFNHVLAVL
jgi:hypothetical protein